MKETGIRRICSVIVLKPLGPKLTKTMRNKALIMPVVLLCITSPVLYIRMDAIYIHRKPPILIEIIDFPNKKINKA
jgi:hypothetical protein